MARMYFSSNPYELKRNLLLYNAVFVEKAVSPITVSGLVSEMARRGFAVSEEACAQRLRRWYAQGLIDPCENGFVICARRAS